MCLQEYELRVFDSHAHSIPDFPIASLQILNCCCINYEVGNVPNYNHAMSVHIHS